MGVILYQYTASIMGLFFWVAICFTICWHHSTIPFPDGLCAQHWWNWMFPFVHDVASTHTSSSSTYHFPWADSSITNFVTVLRVSKHLMKSVATCSHPHTQESVPPADHIWRKLFSMSVMGPSTVLLLCRYCSRLCSLHTSSPNTLALFCNFSGSLLVSL